MNRLGIYFFFDKDGIVDDYVLYFLRNFKKVCSEVCVVVNGNLEPHSKEELEKLSNKLIIRENKGYDSWAYKYALEHYGFEKIKEYDELILCNFTFFGPIFPLSEMFLEMEKRDCDFWGIHRHPAINSYMSGTRIIEHIQSHFIVFNKAILKNKSFKEYWDTLQPISNYEEAIAFHELRCTKYFEDLGYKSSTFIDYTKYFDKVSNSSVFCAVQQIMEDRSPILKRKALFIKRGKIEFPQLNGFDLIEALSFIKDNTQYPIKYIKQNISRCFSNEINLLGIWFKKIFYQIMFKLFPPKTSNKLKKIGMYNASYNLIKYLNARVK